MHLKLPKINPEVISEKKNCIFTCVCINGKWYYKSIFWLTGVSGLMSLTQTRGDAEVQRMDGGKNKKGQTLEWNKMTIHRCLRHSHVLDSNFSKCLNKDYIVSELFTVYRSPQNLSSSSVHKTIIPPPISIENLYWTCSLRVHRTQKIT